VTGDQEGRGVASEVVAVLALRAAPGAYAVLLGSGMSRASGVPTGYEVLVDLCRQVADASGDRESSQADPLGWFAVTTGAEASYDRVLAALTSSREERVGILRRYFEPSPDEAEQGLKVPAAGHVALARLVQAGLVRVVLTTNFDRLVERALDQVGAAYVVTATPDAVAGAMPLHLQDCQVVKLHGDYLDPGMLNTPTELARYEPAVDRLLDRILDEYGLITIGWSTTYDPALRRAIERAATRRFSSWWIEPGTVNEHAERLIALRGSVLVHATG
jgi:SIR2-like domain